MDADPLHAHLEALERALLDPAIRADRVRLDSLIADDFLEIGASGAVFGKAEVLAQLPGESGVALEALSMRVQRVGVDVARVLYIVSRDADGDVRRSLRSSWWRLEAEGRWCMVFHQGTPDSGAGTI